MPDMSPTHIVFPLFAGVTQLDFTGPLQFLSRLPGAQIHIAAADMAPVATDSALSLLPTTGFADCAQADILCVPGGHGVTAALHDPAMLGFIARQAASARWVTAVCTGTFLLGGAGLLSGKRATTHWAYRHLLPMVGANPTPGRVVEDGHIITAGGVTSGMDFALTLIAREAGEDVARAIQLALEYDPQPPFTAGHPDSAPAPVLAQLQARVYDAAAARMADALATMPKI